MRDCSLKASDVNKIYGTSTQLSARLVDNNTPLVDRMLTINVNGRDYHKLTDANGYVYLNINLPPGHYPATIYFPGDSTYNSVRKSVNVHVLRNDIRQDKEQSEFFEVNNIPLNVIMSDGFSTTMGTSIKETDMLKHSSTGNAPTFYFNQGNHGVEFDISIVMKVSYFADNVPVADHLDGWYKNNVPVSVVTDAMDVPNSKYIMTIKSKKQNRKTLSIWKLHFHQFYENNLSFENMYTEKTSSLSSQDLLLLKYNNIDSNSPRDVILVLQQKLLSKGSFRPYDENNQKRVPNGIWDDRMLMDIFMFQALIMNTEKKQGICDRDTINALINEDNYTGHGWYDDREFLFKY